MFRRIIYLINPISGIKTKSGLESVIRRENRKRGIDFDIIHTNAEGDYQYLREKITTEGVTDIVVCGGDGSVNAVAAALMGTGVNIGVVPMGSGNGLANTAKIPHQTAAALEVIFKGHSSYIDGFYINDRFSCMLCGIGFDATVAHEFAKKKRRGLKTYIKVTTTQYFSAQSYPFEVRTPERSFSTEAYFISIANSNQFGNNFTIAPHASLSDGLIDIVIVKKMSKLILPFSLISHVTGLTNAFATDTPAEEGNILYFQTPALTITNPQQALLHIDGDPAPTSNLFTIRVIPHAIKLIQPFV